MAVTQPIHQDLAIELHQDFANTGAPGVSSRDLRRGHAKTQEHVHRIAASDISNRCISLRCKTRWTVHIETILQVPHFRSFGYLKWPSQRPCHPANRSMVGLPGSQHGDLVAQQSSKQRYQVEMYLRTMGATPFWAFMRGKWCFRTNVTPFWCFFEFRENWKMRCRFQTNGSLPSRFAMDQVITSEEVNRI